MTTGHAPLVVYTDVVDTDIGPGRDLLHSNGFRTAVLSGTDMPTVVREAAGATALLVGYHHITAETLEALPTVKLIATQSAGTDMVDLEAARHRGVDVLNVPGAATEEVAVHALALILATLRGLPFLDRAVRQGDWDPTTEALKRPSTLTLSLIGMGQIGRRTAELARPLFGNVVGYDPNVPDDSWPSGIARDTLPATLSAGDVVSLHLPLTPQTAEMIDDDALQRMRRGAVLVNVSRGGLVDHDALVAHLDSGHLAAAALDVLPVEPPTDHQVTRHPRTIVTPHAAYLSDESARDYVRIQAQNVVDWFNRNHHPEVSNP